ncbi:hypothetical protein BH10ACT1_BH10ACT1_27050 [soil metagenome]
MVLGATVLVVAGLATHACVNGGRSADVAYVAALGLTAALAWWGVAVHGPEDRTVWTWIATGVTLSALGDLVWLVLDWTGPEPADVSVADLFWLSSYAALVGGLWTLVARGRPAGGRDVDAIIDSLVAAVVAMLVTWELALQSLLADASVPVAQRWVLASYPVADIVVVALVTRAIFGGRALRSPALVALAAAGLCWFGSDLGFLAVADGSIDTWLNLGWIGASLLLGVAAHLRGPALEQPPERHDELLVPAAVTSRMYLVMAPLLIPGLIELQGYVSGVDADPLPLLLASAVLVGLATWRSHRLVRAAEAARSTVAVREAHYRALSVNSADAVLVLDVEGRIREGGGALARFLGVASDAIPTSPLDQAQVLVDRAAVQALLAKARISPGAVIGEEIPITLQDGTELWFAARVVNLLDDPAVGGIVANLQDITERKRAQQQLTHQAFHDPLTGLANRALFTNRTEQALRRRARSGGDPAILYLDIDGFKGVNDRYGHAGGDALLAEIGHRLRATVRAGDTVARLGGDEFAVLVEDTHQLANEASTTADRLLQVLSLPIELDGSLIAVSASIGLATADGVTTAEGLLRSADIAMYRAKVQGKARTVIYDAKMGDDAGEDLQLRDDLEVALDNGEFELYYQPVVELTDDRVVGFEALLRWHHPERGTIPPDQFIPLCEETGLIVPIGRWVLESACATAARWTANGSADASTTMAVNLAACQLASDAIVDHVAAALEHSGLDATSLVLEITETALVHEPEAAAARLRTLRAMGVRLAIDDFGTGYSSLTYLRQFPVDILKIDRSFVETITTDGALPPIVQGLLDLAHALDLEIVAEGIELQVQRAQLQDQNCQLGQGFLFSRAVPASEAEHLLTASHVAAALAVEPDPEPDPASTRRGRP